MQKLFLRLVFSCMILSSCESNKTTEPSPSVKESPKQFMGLNELHLCTEVVFTPTGKKINGRQAGAMQFLLWPSETRVLHVQFLDGHPKVQEKVMRVAKEWENYCGIQFDFSPNNNPDISISFQPGGSWSVIGKSSKKHSPSMNFGWLKLHTSDEEYHRVVLHEFGHALGLIHEHQNPRGNKIQWDKEKVYAYYAQGENRWTEKEVDGNIFNTYSEDQINGTSFDSLSIMLYSYSPELTLNGQGTPWNTSLSEMDKKLIGELYPKTH